MKKKELTPRQVAIVSCPTCGVPIGKPCVLHSGGLRSIAHIGRRLIAVEEMEGTRSKPAMENSDGYMGRGLHKL